MDKITLSLSKKSKAKIIDKNLRIENIDNVTDENTELKKLILKINLNKTYDPSFRIYTISQNVLSLFIELISQYKELRKFNKNIEKIENEFMPLGPPMSPLSQSYYSYWLFLDYIIEHSEHNTIGSIFINTVKHNNLKIDKRIINAINYLNNSYMGFYQVIQKNNNIIEVEEILTNDTFECICPSGYESNLKDIIYARIVPNLYDINSYSIILTTPYIIIKYSSKDWISFFNRQGINKDKNNFLMEYNNFLKYGKDILYWNNYIMDAYVNYTENCIYLTGIPDIEGSKPHEL